MSFAPLTYAHLERLLDQVVPGLLGDVMALRILEERRYSLLARRAEVTLESLGIFDAERMANFKFIVVTGAPEPDPELVRRMYTLTVIEEQG